MKVRALILSVAAIANSAIAQDYQDYADGYEQDNLYQDYAMKQQEKGGGGGWVRQHEFVITMVCVMFILLIFRLPCKTKQKQQHNNSGGLVKSIGAFGISYLIGAKVHSGRISKKMKTKHLKDQKTLYTQYYNDVYRLEEQKAEQQAVIEQLQAALA